MLEMIKARKEQLQAKGVKGFTLMEMLIVIAIIAILIAIAIPVFTAQLQKAELATDAANVRSEYAEQLVSTMDAGNSSYTISLSALQSACTKSTVSVDDSTTPNKIVVTHDDNSNLSESFTIDSDVTVS